MRAGHADTPLDSKENTVSTWRAYEGTRFDLSGPALEQRWPKLHAGNLEPFPADPAVQAAWRAYHEGRFEDAFNLGKAHGGLGLVAAAFAATIYAQYLESEEEKKVAIFEMAMEVSERATEACPDNANAHYMLAVSQGRYSQFISMVEALAKGLAPKIRGAAERCLELQPDHAEGHVTLAGWHAEIVDKVGGMLAGLSFGAKKDQAEEHYDRALALAPASPVPYIEKANGLLLMYGESSKEDAMQLLQKAVTLDPADAMQALDIERARRQLAELPSMTF
jgi:tetratricopeptide (TPR) repeat protein